MNWSKLTVIAKYAAGLKVDPSHGVASICCRTDPVILFSDVFEVFLPACYLSISNIQFLNGARGIHIPVKTQSKSKTTS